MYKSIKCSPNSNVDDSLLVVTFVFTKKVITGLNNITNKLIEYNIITSQNQKNYIHYKYISLK